MDIPTWRAVIWHSDPIFEDACHLHKGERRYLFNAFWSWSSVKKATKALGYHGNVFTPQMKTYFDIFRRSGILESKYIRQITCKRNGKLYTQKRTAKKWAVYRVNLKELFADLASKKELRAALSKTIDEAENRQGMINLYNEMVEEEIEQHHDFLNLAPSKILVGLRKKCWETAIASMSKAELRDCLLNFMQLNGEDALYVPSLSRAAIVKMVKKARSSPSP